MRETLRAAARAMGDGALASGLLQAAAGLPWALRHRRVLPPEVESGLRRLDDAGQGLGAD